MMLANLYRKAGQERSAVTSYKEVLRQCPLALDAIIGACAHRDAFIQQTTFNLLRHLHLKRIGSQEFCLDLVIHLSFDRSVCEKCSLNKLFYFPFRSSLFVSQRSRSGVHDYGRDPEYPQPGLALCLGQSICLHTCRGQSKSHQHHLVSRAVMLCTKSPTMTLHFNAIVLFIWCVILSQFSWEEVSVAGQRGPPGEPGRCLLQGRWHQECHPQIWASPDAGPVPHQRCAAGSLFKLLNCILQWILSYIRGLNINVSQTRQGNMGLFFCPGKMSVMLFALAGMDVYGYLMAREGHLEDVEVLGGRLFNISDQHAEPWVISGWVWVCSVVFIVLCLRHRSFYADYRWVTVMLLLTKSTTWNITVLWSLCKNFEFVCVAQLSQLLQQALLQGPLPGSQGHPAEQQQRAGSPPERGSAEKHGSRSRSHHPLQGGHALGTLQTRLLWRHVWLFWLFS